jgi:hypothetical protein
MASSSHIKPNEEGRITVRVDTARRNGKLIKTADILSNDPQRPKVILTLKATIKQPDPSNSSR